MKSFQREINSCKVMQLKDFSWDALAWSLFSKQNHGALFVWRKWTTGLAQQSNMTFWVCQNTTNCLIQFSCPSKGSFRRPQSAVKTLPSAKTQPKIWKNTNSREKIRSYLRPCEWALRCSMTKLRCTSCSVCLG